MFEEDYISCLLNWIKEMPPDREGAYLRQQQQEDAALDAMEESFSDQQKKLFLKYEEQRNISASIYSDLYARQAFLLARDIFRP